MSRDLRQRGSRRPKGVQLRRWLCVNPYRARSASGADRAVGLVSKTVLHQLPIERSTVSGFCPPAPCSCAVIAHRIRFGYRRPVPARSGHVLRRQLPSRQGIFTSCRCFFRPQRLAGSRAASPRYDRGERRGKRVSEASPSRRPTTTYSEPGHIKCTRPTAEMGSPSVHCAWASACGR